MKPTYCNPICIEDVPGARALDAILGRHDVRAYNDYRSIADPSVIYHDGKWIMYPSYGFAYVTEDFVYWKKVDIGLDINNIRFSPAVVNFRGKWYMSGHSVSGMYVSDSPLGPFKHCGNITDVNGNEVRPLDGCYLADGDRLYFYWAKIMRPENGEDMELVIGTVGVECDPDEPWRFITEPVWINKFSPEKEWERHGEHNQNERIGWIEGQWMIKIDGRYYLLYSGSGTQFATYATGIVYSDEGPLSGFKRQQNHDPLTRKPYGLVRGAGHGSIVEGPDNTYWIFYTCLFGYNYKYERRVCMDVLGIDENGELYCPELSETPQFAPGVKKNPEKRNGTGLLPLTFMQPASASSNTNGREPIYATDDSVLTWWQPKPEDTDKILTIDLGSEKGYYIEALRIIWRDIGMDTLDGITPGPFKYIAEYSEPNSDEWKVFVDASGNDRDLCIDYRQFEGCIARRVRLKIVGSPKGIEPGVTSFTVFGKCAH